MRYGMNPHQAARLVSKSNPLRVLNAWQLVHSAETAIDRPIAASFKHVSPAEVATAGPLDAAADVGVETIIEPGGSIRTTEISNAASELGMRHVQTGLRLFHH